MLQAGVSASRAVSLAVLAACSAGDRPGSEPLTRTIPNAAGSSLVTGGAPVAGDAPAGIDAPVTADAAVIAPAALSVIRSLPGIDLIESVTHAQHAHGGSPASIGSASINFEVRDQRAHDIAVQKIELLHGHCRETTWSDRTPLTLAGHEAYTWTDYDPIARGGPGVTLPAGKPRRFAVRVLFAPVTAYQACDRFAFAIDLTVDRVPLAIETPLQVMRYEPLRRPAP